MLDCNAQLTEKCRLQFASWSMAEHLKTVCKNYDSSFGCCLTLLSTVRKMCIIGTYGFVYIYAMPNTGYVIPFLIRDVKRPWAQCILCKFELVKRFYVSS